MSGAPRIQCVRSVRKPASHGRVMARGGSPESRRGWLSGRTQIPWGRRLSVWLMFGHRERSAVPKIPGPGTSDSHRAASRFDPNVTCQARLSGYMMWEVSESDCKMDRKTYVRVCTCSPRDAREFGRTSAQPPIINMENGEIRERCTNTVHTGEPWTCASRTHARAESCPAFPQCGLPHTLSKEGGGWV